MDGSCPYFEALRLPVTVTRNAHAERGRLHFEISQVSKYPQTNSKRYILLCYRFFTLPASAVYYASNRYSGEMSNLPFNQLTVQPSNWN